MKKIILLTGIGILILSCSKAFFSEVADNPKSNFNELWEVIDKKYTFFELKNIDWKKVKADAESKIKDDMTKQELFNVLDDMLQVLEDGHVSLIADVDRKTSDKLFKYPPTFDKNIIDYKYLRTEHNVKNKNVHTTGGVSYTKLLQDRTGNKNYINGADYILYLYYDSFMKSLGELENIIKENNSNPECKGVILDIRNNLGGNVNNVTKLGEIFAGDELEKENILFSSDESLIKMYTRDGDYNKFKLIDNDDDGIFVKVKKGGINKRPLVIITNRMSYSAGSFFPAVMKSFTKYSMNNKIKIVGDTTGGGSGLPADYELPNNWHLTFSGTRSEYFFDGKWHDFELGVPPTDAYPAPAFDTNEDLWIERAIKDITTFNF